MKQLDEALDFLQKFSFEKFEGTEKDVFWTDYLTKVKRMTGSGILELINKTCSFMDEDACYLEIGIHQGSTLIGASLNNPHYFFGIDPFCGHNAPHDHPGFSSVEEALKYNIKSFSKGNVEYVAEYFQKYLDGKNNINGKKVQVFFSDGDHGFEQTYQTLVMAPVVLDDVAIVILDDTQNNDKGAVEAAINKALQDNLGYFFVKEYGMRSPNHPVDWCGCCVLLYEKRIDESTGEV